jgi:hypothetical protein
MSSAIVIEALGLVTWWGLGRMLRGVVHPRRADRARVPVPPG